MRSDRRKNEATVFAQITKRWAVVFLLITILFGCLLGYTNIFSPKYLLIIGLFLLLIVVIAFPPLFSTKAKKSARWGGLIISIFATIIYLVGARYLYSTINFVSKITNVETATEYYVVVRDDDVYNDLSDIDGGTVYAYENGSDFQAAVEKLMEEVSIYVEPTGNLEALSSQLLSGEIDITYMQSVVYDGLVEDVESFDDYTKILHTIKIEKELLDIRKPVSVTTDPFNLYVTGIDTTGTIDVVSRSDVNMIVTVNPKTKTILMTSIPRDYYVLLPDVGEYDKLTHTGMYGSDYTINTVEHMLGIDMNYYAKVNFSTVEYLVDAIGGIEVESEYSFTSRIGKYDFVEGINYLDGKQALAFARERYSFEDGDFQRNKNQQIVLKAIINKMTQSSTLLMNFPSILNSVENNLETNLTSSEIKALVRMQTSDMSSWNIMSQNLVGPTSSEPCYSLGYQNASVVLQSQESNDAAVEGINFVLSE